MVHARLHLYSKLVVSRNPQISFNNVTPRAYLRGGVQGVQTPAPKFSDFFLKSEGKEIERKRKKSDVGGGGGDLLTYFWG